MNFKSLPGEKSLMWAIVLLIAVVIIIIVCIILVFIYANRTVFPTKTSKKIYDEHESRPGEEDMVKGVINVKIYDQFDQRNNNVFVVYCHGNTGNLSQRGYVVKMCKSLGWNLALFDYRGYGKSKKYPDPRNIMEDSHAVYKKIRRDYPQATIVIWGESLGGGPAVYIAKMESKDHRRNRLVLLSTYSSLYDVIDYGTQDGELQKSLKTFLLSMGVGNIDNSVNIRKTKTKTTIIHSTEDHYINFKNAEKLYKSAGDNATLIPIKGDHPAPVITTSEMLKILKSIDVPHDPITDGELISMADNFRHAATVYHLRSC